jgi:putative FmdB family regulatory protein
LKETDMPRYDYECKECGHEFEVILTLRQHEEAHKPACPKCKSHKVQQRPVAFQAVTSHKG